MNIEEFHITPPELSSEEFLINMYALVRASNTLTEREIHLCALQTKISESDYKWISILEILFHGSDLSFWRNLTKKIYIERMGARIKEIYGYYDNPDKGEAYHSSWFGSDEYKEKIVLFLEGLNYISFNFMEKDFIRSVLLSYRFQVVRIPDLHSLRYLESVTVVRKQ